MALHAGPSEIGNYNGAALPDASQLHNPQVESICRKYLELRYQPKTGVQLALGASNLFDTYPRKTPTYLDTTGVVGFPYYSPFGFNGRYLYVRAGLRW